MTNSWSSVSADWVGVWGAMSSVVMLSRRRRYLLLFLIEESLRFMEWPFWCVVNYGLKLAGKSRWDKIISVFIDGGVLALWMGARVLIGCVVLAGVAYFVFEVVLGADVSAAFVPVRGSLGAGVDVVDV